MSETVSIRTLGELPAYYAGRQPGKIALSFEGRDTSFGQFEIHSSQVANGLIAMGLQADDRIAYLGKNSDWYFELIFGAFKSGVVVAPVGWRLAEPEVAFILEHSEAKALFVEPEFLDLAQSLVARLAPERVVLMRAGGEGHVLFDAWRDAQSTKAPKLVPQPSDTAMQIYTSGTTGRPKGAMLTHYNFIRMRELLAAQNSPASRYLPDDIALLAMPVSHVGGTSTGIWALYHGIKSVVARQFDPDDVLGYIQNERVNNFFLVPSALQRIVRDPRARSTDFSRLRYILYGGSPMPPQLLAECIDVFKCGFAQGYGSTETCATIIQLPPEDHIPGSPRLRSCGKPLPGVEIAIRDAEGNDLPVGAVGEIVTRSSGNMAGYWRDPEATARTIDAEGWLRTGDAGYLDADGYLYIHDRVKDMIVSGGENIYPAEVENAIFGHPAVAEVAVIGVPSDRWGEEVKAVVALRPGMTATEQEIIAWARSNIAAFKAPKSVDFIDALPKSGASKILRRALRAPYWAGRERQVN